MKTSVVPGRTKGKRLLLTLALLGGVASAQSSPPAPSSAAAGTPLSLEAALARLAQSPSVTQAQLAVKVAQTNLNAARAALGLTVSVSGNASYTGSYATTNASGQNVTVPSATGGLAGVNATVGILPWSGAQTSLRSAQRSLALAEAKLFATQNSARLNVVQQYLSAVTANQDIALANQTLALRQRQLAIAQTQRANGNATDSDVLSAQAAVQSAQAAQIQASANLQAARLSLGAALGTDVGNVTFSSQPGSSFTLPDVNALVTQARATRAEVLDAQNTLGQAQDKLEELRRNATLPDLTASVRYGPASSGGLSASLNLQQGTLGAGYSVPFGGSDGGNRVVASVSGSYVVYSPAQKAQISAAEANVTQAQLTVSVQQQTVELDVRTKYSAAQASLVTLQSSATQVQVAELGLTTAKTRLQAGTGTADDITTAELNLAQAQRNLINARATAQVNVQALLNAAGGLQ